MLNEAHTLYLTSTEYRDQIVSVTCQVCLKHIALLLAEGGQKPTHYIIHGTS